VAQLPAVRLALPYNREVFAHYKDEMNFVPRELSAPPGSAPVVVTTNRLTEHWHTGIMTRNLQRLAMLFPEPFAEIPRELAAKLGIRDGDIVEIGNNRARIYLRALVTYRAPVLEVAGQRVYVVNIPWHWGFSGLHASTSVANFLTPDYMDTTTTMQESKVFLAYIRKAPRSKYVYMKVSEFIKTAKSMDMIPS
jgi:formate dehydrogenase major subunit